MPACIQASPLLTLPLELRTKIYQHLLSPDPTRVHTLYHDTQGKETSFDIDPTILRVNKHVYSEAISILYDAGNVRIYLATPVIAQCTRSINYDDPPNLFRACSEEAFKLAKKDPQRRLKPAAQGYIYPHCFQRLRTIELVTSRHAIWGDGWCGSYFSQTGKTVLRILKLLAEEQTWKSSKTKSIKFTLQPDWRTVQSQLVIRNGEMNGKTKAIVGLLKALKRRTDIEVEVEEGVFTKTLRELEMEEGEVDEWEKVLLSDDVAGL